MIANSKKSHFVYKTVVIQAHKVQPNVGKWWSYHHSLSWWCCHLQFTWFHEYSNACIFLMEGKIFDVLLGTKCMQTEVGHLVSLKTSVSTKCSILKISALGLLAQHVRLIIFCTDFTILEIFISNVHTCTPAKCTFSTRA